MNSLGRLNVRCGIEQKPDQLRIIINGCLATDRLKKYHPRQFQRSIPRLMWRENSYRGTSRAESDSPLSQPRETAIVVFGSGMFGKDVPLKGQQSGVVGILWKELKKREANGEVVVATIDEYLTSQICHTCLSRILENVVTDDGVKHHRIQVCKSCRTL